MTPHRRLTELDAQLAPYEEPSFEAGLVDHLLEQIDRFAVEIERNPTAPNAGVFAREIRANCRQARGRVGEWREKVRGSHD